MNKTVPKILFLFWLSVLTIKGYGQSQAKSKAFRGLASVGTWMSQYRQTSPGHDAKVSSLLAPAFGINVGFRIGYFFFEYSPVWGMSPYSANPKPRDATYLALLGGTTGISIGSFPIEPFVGYERGRYALSSGAEPVYTKGILKLGLNLLFPFAKRGRYGFRVEYRSFKMGEDDTGGLPANVNTSAQVYFASIMIGM